MAKIADITQATINILMAGITLASYILKELCWRDKYDRSW
jgi:hypothetical protein